MKPSEVLQEIKELELTERTELSDIQKQINRRSGGSISFYQDVVSYLWDTAWDFDRAIALAKQEEK